MSQNLVFSLTTIHQGRKKYLSAELNLGPLFLRFDPVCSLFPRGTLKKKKKAVFTEVSSVGGWAESNRDLHRFSEDDWSIMESRTRMVAFDWTLAGSVFTLCYAPLTIYNGINGELSESWKCATECLQFELQHKA